MDYKDLKYWSKAAADWAHEYYAGLGERPVRAQIQPGETLAKLAVAPPENGEDIATIFEDFKRIVPDGMTHWQHPRFFAYFPSNAAPASVLAEQLANTISAQCMLWQTSPAATEMEIRMIDWLRQALGLADHFTGLIQDSATTTTLSAVLTMRERALNWQGLEDGLFGSKPIRIYASAQNHSSIDKAVRLAGIGQQNLVKIPTGPDHGMDVAALQAAIASDKHAGYIPAGILICMGGTSIGASDDVAEIIKVAKSHDLYTHVDAAWAGSAMICPEFRSLWAGVDGADSIVINPHKWLGANFDCSVQFLSDPTPQIRTLSMRPDYLKTAAHDDVTNFSEWSIPLGRRFRALKLWFLIRAYGLDGLRSRIRNHVAWCREVEAVIAALPGFQIVTPCNLALFTFRYKDDAKTQELLERVNADGRIYLTQTSHDGAYVIRVTVGQFDCTRDDVMMIPKVLSELA